jgi:hypothetical protein
MRKYILLLLFYILYCNGQDLSIKGMFDTFKNDIKGPKVLAQVYGKCFQGVGLVTCEPIFPDDDYTLSRELPYFLTVGQATGAFYCLECCSSVPSNIDVWDMYCPVTDATMNQINLYGYEARLARNAFEGDTEIVRCPLKRTACKYDDIGNTLSCNRTGDNTFLSGYKLTMDVVQYNVNFKTWKGVTNCEIESHEANHSIAGSSFHEEIIMRHFPPQIPPWDYPQVAFFSLFIIVIVYGLVYFCRKKHCPYCGNKLVISCNLCYKCRWVGVKPPDPVLLQALEEKGQLLQGNIPGAFPGSRWVVKFCRFLFISICCNCKKKVKVAPSKYDLAIKDLDESIEMMESKIQAALEDSDEETKQAVEKKRKKYKNNPNILEVDSQIIYEAVQHPKFIKT